MSDQEHTTNVTAAFEMLVEEIENEIEFVNKAGARAFITGDYDRVDEARRNARDLTELREEIRAVRRRWRALSEAFDPEADDDETTKAERRNLGRLQRGVRMPEDAYRLPILQALAGMGGSGRVRDVLKKVEESMHGSLSEVDYEPLPSNPDMPRWYNTAQWCRLSLVKEGLLRDNSPRGVWEISDQGRQYAANGP